ncbi:MAG: GAF domain-containing protein [Anaerolineales bacterium]|nr:GAF domain-containing protein [Anaerolineales bacterium]
MPTGVYPMAKQIGEMSRLAGDIKALLSTQKEMLHKAGLGYPPGVMDGLSNLRDTLERLHALVEKQEAEVSRLRALAETSSVINSSLNLTLVLNEVMDTIIHLTGAERGFLMLKDSQGELQFRVARNVERESLNSEASQISRTVVEQVANNGEPVVTTNAQADPRFSAQESVVGYNLRSIVCVPLKFRGQITGVIYVDNRIRTGLFTESERDLLAAFGNQAAIAIENARQFEEVSELKNLLDNVFTSMASGVITTDFQDQITLANRAASDILGRAVDDMVGRPLLSAPGFDEGFAGVVRRVKQERQAVVGHELRAILPDRGPLDWSLNVAPLKDGPGGAAGLAIVLDDLTEKKRLQGKFEVFKRMVPPAVINRLNPESLALGGTRKEVSIIFADIQGFTALSETLDPEVLIKVLNQYVGTAAEAMLLHEATVDKYVGDAVMAFFNAPDDQPDHALRAVRAAIRMRDDIFALHEVMEPQFRLSFRIAVHLGEAVVGLVGTQDRLDYTIIGDTVNTAKRLQENGLPGKVFLSDKSYERVKAHVRVNPLEPLHVKNRVQPVPVFELLDLIG